MKTIHLPDELHWVIKKIADENHRSIIGEIAWAFRSEQGSSGVVRGKNSSTSEGVGVPSTSREPRKVNLKRKPSH